MRYGIISDIHGNLNALEAVLDRLGEVDCFICPGDIVGYGPDPRESVSLVRSLRCVAVLGNHDAAVSGVISAARFNSNARKAADWTRSVLDESSRLYLASRPLSYAADGFIVVHGSLDDPSSFPYVYSPATARRCFDEMKDYTLCFLGHSHISEIFVQKLGSFGADQIAFTNGGKLDFRPGFRYIVNCGSVGQPRDGNKDAGCGIYDSESNMVEILRVPYDISAVQSRMRRANLPELLIERLEYGE